VQHFIRSISKATPCRDTSPPSLHDALPIFPPCSALFPVYHSALAGGPGSGPGTGGGGRCRRRWAWAAAFAVPGGEPRPAAPREGDRKSTRLNSSHVKISYAVFCLKKKMSTR